MGVTNSIDITSSQRKTIVSLLKKYLPDTVVWVYGSRAKWTSNHKSDLDMVAFATKEQKHLVSSLKEAFEESDLPFRVDLFIWDEVPEKFRKNIEAEHVILQEMEKHEIPGEWISGRLSDIAEVIMGQSPSGDTCNSSGNGTPLLNGPTEYGAYHPYPVQFTSDPKKLSEAGDILFCVRGSTTGRMNWADRKYAIGRGIAAIRHRKGLKYQPFLRAVIDHNLSTLLASATGSTFPNVSRNQLLDLEILLPSDSEQKAIAHILGSLDDKIELNRKMNETLEAMAQALFKSWFIDFDPVIDNAILAGKSVPDCFQEKYEERKQKFDSVELSIKDYHSLFPDEFTESDKMGWIPKGWSVSQLKEIAIFSNGKTSPERSEGDIPVFGSNGRIGFCSKHNRNDVIIVGRVGTYCGSLHYCRSLCWVTDNAMTAEMHNKENNTYLLELLKLASLNERRGGSGQPLLNQTILGLIKLVKPSDEEISQFTKHSLEFYKKIDFNNHEINIISYLRDILLPKLLSGEIRINEAEKLVEGLK